MRYTLLLTLLFSITNTLFAAQGDTTWIQAHDESHWTWYGNYDVKAYFPETDQNFEKILFELTIGCPDGGCSEWDYFTKYSARIPTGEIDTTHNYDSLGVLTIDTTILYEETELARYITPYAGNYENTWSRTYYFDVTDYQSIFNDSVIIRGFYDGWQDGWKISTRFAMIEGTPGRSVIGYANLWTGRYTYGEVDNPIQNQVTPQTVQVPAGAKYAKIKAVTTGHRFGGAENCAEFCEKTHSFHVDGQKAGDQYLWRTTCGENPEFPQAGTWLYDRAGWCPGEEVFPYEYNITEFINKDSITIDYQFDDYTWDNGNPPAPSYYIGAQVIFYSDHAYSYDGEVNEIVAPSTKFRHHRYNPICANPIIVLRNNGLETMKHGLIEFGLVNGEPNYHYWVGNLEYGEVDTVTLNLPEERTNLWQGVKEGDQFYAEIKNLNYKSDENDDNDRKTSTVNIPPTYDNSFIIRLKTNNAFEETTFTLKHSNGNLLYQSEESLQSRTTYDQEVKLTPGCYIFEVKDSDEDGIDWWANNDGSGRIEFRTPESPSVADIKRFEGDFGTGFTHQFRVGTPMDIKDINTPEYKVWPNPSNGLLHIQLKNTQANSSINIFNQLGQNIRTIENATGVSNIQLNEFAGQILFIEIKSGDSVFTEKVMIY